MIVYPIDPAPRTPTATVFDIQSFSLQDGPGIRTTIFFKGCPLRCQWCHNPESYSAKPQLMFHSNLCVGCFECVRVCPSGAQQTAELEGRKVHVVDQSRCTGCGKCLEVCCYDALDLLGKTMTPQQLWQRVQGDLTYYRVKTAGGQTGGITLSGGEPMLHVDFIEEFLNLTGDMHVAMETSGYAKTEDYLRLAQRIKLFLFDYKATGSQRHKELCGVDNALILHNLQALYDAGCDIVLRLPMIPGVNDTQEHFDAIAELLRTHPRISQAEIMAYHTLGISKADGLGMDTPLRDIPPATAQQKEEWLNRFRKLGVEQVTVSQ